MDSDPAVLKTEGYHMFNVGVDFAKAVTALQTGLTALEQGDTPPWGDDDIGEKFGVVYEGLRDGMYDSMGSLAERIAGMGVAFTKMGVAHELNEAEQEAIWRETTAEYDGQVKMPPGVATGTLHTKPTT
ncbi:hypothetical protein IM697_34490 [Streptomyces ferrugineus]|uniref:WXG100 family type VII secretion target n=1 Tax=Streptomyces ferrugineus TaxID=1413221 RepID=A0A7M2SHB3_9ACTN|nr:hypothetical protein [Streptomyces ferrugineus]QOV35145.1 hypothetical protein IM697_34490 [Streptomyces ferrugineus]